MGDFELAKEMIAEAALCGADYVKMQKRDIASISPAVRNKPYEGEHSFGKTYGEHRKNLEFGKNQWHELKEYAESRGVGFFATPFDIESLFFLSDELKTPYIKFGTTQMHDQQMIKCAKDFSHPPLILSTGCSTLEEVCERCEELRPQVLMQTTSAYPCPEEAVFLNVINTYKTEIISRYPAMELGLSGHYSSGNGGIEAAGVALGIKWIERHFTLDRTWKGTDQACSLEPVGLRTVVKTVRSVERAFGTNEKRILECEMKVAKMVR